MNVGKQPDILGSGLWSQSFLYAYVSSWAGPDGWAWKQTHQNRAPMLPGDEFTVFGAVTSKDVEDGLGYVEIDMGLRIPDGTTKTPAHATVVLPLRGGRPVPYPFTPPAAS